tara:strand:+ start:17334 stop:18239 length:906 start_codon:yes stop_codon:yes gene_type:complete
MKKVMVTGGAGFIGSHLVEYLSKSYRVVVIDNLSQGNKLKNINNNIRLVKGDVRDYDLVKYHSKNCTSIFHLAAILGVDVVSEKNIETMDCEFEGIKNVCSAAKKNKLKKIIYASSSGVYGQLNYKGNVKESAVIQPSSAYSMAKRACEVYLKYFYKETKINSVAVRLFNVYGPRQDDRMVIPRFIDQAKSNKSITVYGNGKQTRDFTYIDDCVKTFDLIDKKVTGHHILNSSRGKEFDIYSLAKMIKKKIKSKSNISKVNVPKKIQEFQVMKRSGDSSKLFKLIRFKPNTDLIDGLNKII